MVVTKGHCACRGQAANARLERRALELGREAAAARAEAAAAHDLVAVLSEAPGDGAAVAAAAAAAERASQEARNESVLALLHSKVAVLLAYLSKA